MTVVREMIDNNRKLAWFFIHELSRNLGGSDTKIVNLTQKHIRGRLAEALMVLRENYGYEEDESTLKIYMSREDLANLSNMTTANAIRTLSTFVDERLITVDGRRIRIINESQLRKSVNSVNTVWNNSPYFTSISGNRQIIDNKYFFRQLFLIRKSCL